MHEELGTNNLTNIINLYKTMKNAGIPREDIIELSEDYFTIPVVRNDLEILLDEVRRQEDNRDQFMSDWQELNNRNMDLKRENRYQREENRDLEKKNRDLEIKNGELEKKNRDLEIKNGELEKKNRDLESIACEKESLDTKMKDQQRAAPRLIRYTEQNSSNKTYTSGDQGYPYLFYDSPSVLPTKSSKSLSKDGGNSSPVSSCHNLAEDETKSIDPIKDLAPSNPKSPDTTVSPSTHNLLKKEPHDVLDT
jgi:myosin heavy subunit